MEKIILCPKSLGNTYKVCKYLSDNSNFKLKTINENTKINLEDYDTVIIASGIYANHVHKNIIRWINNIENNKKSNTKISLFLTWLGRGESDKAAYDEVKQLLKNKNISLEPDYSSCFGKSMFIIKTNHPNEKDKNKILDWANEL